MVNLHIETDDPRVQLHRYRGSSVGLVVMPVNAIVIAEYSDIVCRAPCDRVVEGRNGEEYYFSGSGLSSSGHFQLYDAHGSIAAKVNSGSNAMRWAGIGLTFGSLGFILAGAGFYAIGNRIRRDFPDDGSSVKTAGAVLIGIGAAALVTGIVLWVSGRTTYELTPGRF